MGNITSYMKNSIVDSLKNLKSVIPNIFNTKGDIEIPESYLVKTDRGTYILKEFSSEDQNEDEEFYDAEDDKSESTELTSLDTVQTSLEEESEEESEIPEFENEWEEIESDFQIVRRLNVNTYAELIYRLEVLLELNPEFEHRFFTLRIHYRPLNDREKVKVTDERFLSNLRIRDMFSILTADVNRLEEMYGVNLLYEDDETEVERNLVAAYLSELNPMFGKGNKNFNFVFTMNNKLYSIIFPETDCKCLVDCVYSILGKRKTDRFFKNTSFKKKKFEEMKSLIKEHLGVEVQISQSLETLKYDLLHPKSNIITLYSRDGHVGYMREGIEDYEEAKFKTQFPKFKNKQDVIICGYDCEYEYALEDGKYVPKKSNMVCAAFESNVYKAEKVFKNFSQFLMFIETLASSKHKDIYCYAHNAQKVENPFVLQEIVRMKNLQTCQVFNFNGNKIKSYSYQISTKIKKPEPKIKYMQINFIDTLCYVKANLETIVSMFDLTTSKGHVDMPENMSEEEKNNWYFNKKWDINNPKDVQYCMNDAVICLELVGVLNKFALKVFGNDIKRIYIKANKDLSGENKKYCDLKNMWVLNRVSMASVCRTLFHNLYPEILNTSEDASLFKTMYYGGRNECFYIGESNPKNKIYAIDINSSYPFQMMNGFAGKYIGNHITKLDYYNYDILETKHIKDYIELNPSHRWCAYMVLKYKEKMKFPLLALNENGKLLFPNIMNYKLMPIWDVEYEAIKDNLDIKSIEYVGFFKPCNLKEQLLPLANIKMTTKIPALRNFAKLCLNSIYGIMGMDCYRPFKKIIKKNQEFICESTDYIVSPGFDDYQWLQYKHFTHVNAAFQCASSITAQARLQLWEMFNFIDKLGFKVLYTDTDSVMFEAPGNIDYKNLFSKYLDETEFGKWDISIYDRMNIFTNKVYYFLKNNSCKLKFKGLSNPETIKIEDIGKNCEFLVKGTKVNKALNVEIYSYMKKFSLKYLKGKVLKSGIVEPFIV